MKQKLTIIAVLLMAAMAIPAVAQKKQPKDPDHAKYVIKAVKHNDVRGDRLVYWLDNVVPQNINFDMEGKYDGHYDSITQKVSFIFRNASTIPSNKINDTIILWRKLKNGSWKQDAEKTENKLKFETSKIMSVMLVLDCSGSMTEDGSNNFAIMKRNALEFLDMLYMQSDMSGNIHVGVIGFSTTTYADEHTLSPLPLNRSNYDRIYAHINNLQSIKQSGTAYYYSLDKAVEILERHYNNIGDKALFSGAAIVGFSDGKDNLSMNIKKAKPIVSTDQYLEYLQIPSNFCDRRIGGKELLSTAICFLGNNVDEEEWQSMLSDTRSIFNCGHGDRVRSITDIKKLKEAFDQIAKNLIERNTVLVCQVPSAIIDDVAWTIVEYDNYVPPASPAPQSPKQPVKIWMGVGLEGGLALMSYEKYSYSEYYGTYYLSEEGTESHPFGGLHVDAAWPLSTSFALGATASLTYCDGIGFAVGPLAKVTFKNNSALLASIGIRNIIDGIHPYLSVGWKFSSPWYISAFTTLNGGLWDFGVGVGYSILGGK